MLLALFAVAISACGGGDRQDANEPSGVYKVDIVKAKFNGRQYKGNKEIIAIQVKNIGNGTIPNLAVTLDGLNQRLSDPNLADPERPIWVVDRPPLKGITAYTGTYAVGPVPPRQSRTLVWQVTAVMSGTYTVRYLIAAGLDGKAKAVQADGSPAKGSFLVHVANQPRPVQDPLE
jgi:hypothetical protein